MYRAVNTKVSLNTYKLALELQTRVESNMIGVGSLNIKRIPHQVSYIDSHNNNKILIFDPLSSKDESFALSSILTSKNIATIIQPGTKINIEAAQYVSNSILNSRDDVGIKFDQKQFHIMGLTKSQDLANEVRFPKYYQRHEIVSNITRSALDKQEWIQIFNNNKITLINAQNSNDLLIDTLVDPILWGFFNQSNKFYLDAVKEFKERINPLEYPEARQAFENLALLKGEDHERLLNSVGKLAHEGLIKTFLKDTLQ